MFYPFYVPNLPMSHPLCLTALFECCGLGFVYTPVVVFYVYRRHVQKLDARSHIVWTFLSVAALHRASEIFSVSSSNSNGSFFFGGHQLNERFVCLVSSSRYVQPDLVARFSFQLTLHRCHFFLSLSFNKVEIFLWIRILGREFISYVSVKCE